MSTFTSDIELATSLDGLAARGDEFVSAIPYVPGANEAGEKPSCFSLNETSAIEALIGVIFTAGWIISFWRARDLLQLQ